MSGETVKLMCIFLSEDKEFIQWSFNEGSLPMNALVGSDYTLTVTEFNYANVGDYKCSADDSRNHIRFYDTARVSIANLAKNKYALYRYPYTADTNLNCEFFYYSKILYF